MNEHDIITSWNADKCILEITHVKYKQAFKGIEVTLPRIVS